MENNNQSPSKTVERLESNAHYTSEALQTLTAQNSNYRFTVGISPAKDGNINTKRAHATIFTDTPNNAQHELFKTWCISNFTVAGLCNIIRYEI